ncbi:hypothetical protein D3218_03830 [Aureimonas flava]|uniref:Inositolphosphotransferase Aur1/Ipt1 domain-containing protein n=1 Tax=Aureimonas flava TaxID=2320271 RepID=A0A3A1WQL9_9HYPH|nr:phosphatase PAP2 family protein [Aureimonas flava]RIY02510.1 hypothetical protein D3218_03830 [Aureimonas flava]
MILDRLLARPGERILATALACACLIVAVVAPLRGAPIDIPGYRMQAYVVAVLALVGIVYRLTGRDERIASGMLSIALLLLFTSALATYNYLLLPNFGFPLDPWLARFDALIGYRWSDWVEWSAGVPHLARLLGWIYASTLMQIAVLIVVLTGLRRWNTLDRMQVTLVFASVATVAFWGLFPSISISAFQAISPEAARIVAPAVGMEAGAELLHLVRHGPDRIAPGAMTGLIGFPSFHTVLALLCVRFAWEAPILRYPYLAINLAMAPAILLHGSHYMLDLAGGALFFWGAQALATRVVAALDRPARVEAGIRAGAGSRAAAARP